MDALGGVTDPEEPRSACPTVLTMMAGALLAFTILLFAWPGLETREIYTELMTGTIGFEGASKTRDLRALALFLGLTLLFSTALRLAITNVAAEMRFGKRVPGRKSGHTLRVS